MKTLRQDVDLRNLHILNVGLVANNITSHLFCDHQWLTVDCLLITFATNASDGLLYIFVILYRFILHFVSRCPFFYFVIVFLCFWWFGLSKLFSLYYAPTCTDEDFCLQVQLFNYQVVNWRYSFYLYICF